MQYRELGRTGWRVSASSLGAWAIGGSWGEVNDQESMAALHKAVDCGVNFFDTSDVYGDGHSERLLRQLRQERSEEIVIATKAGRRLEDPIATRGPSLLKRHRGEGTGLGHHLREEARILGIDAEGLEL